MIDMKAVRQLIFAFGLASVCSIAAAQAPMPQPHTQDGVTYLNGGIGDEEVQFIKQSMKDYTLALSFSRSTGEYVASVAVTIKDMKGATVLEEQSVGPYLLVRLPPAKYSVTANYQGDSKTQPVTASHKPAIVNFAWR
jgi:hypothetical protein